MSKAASLPEEPAEVTPAEVASKSNGNEAPKEPKIAVLVIHGVAVQAAGQSLDQVTDMLTSYRPKDGGFVRERQVEFPYRQDPRDIPQLIDKAEPPEQSKPPLKNKNEEEKKKETCEELVMRQALENYSPCSRDHYFKTACNIVRWRSGVPEKKPQKEGQTPESAAPKEKRIRDGTQVHLFECFWADLSRGRPFDYFAKFVEFYQFVLDLCSLGRSSLEYASRERPSSPFWKPLKALQRCCEFIITGAIPVLNILLICLLLFSPVLCQNKDFQRWLFPAGAGFGTIIAVAFWLGPYSGLKFGDERRKHWFMYAIGIGLLVSIFVFWIFNTPPGDISRTMRLATLCGWVAILAGLCAWANNLQAVRPYLATNFKLAIPFSMLVLLWAIGRDPLNDQDVGKRALLHLAEVLMALGQIAWFTFFFLAAILVLLSSAAMRSFQPRKQKGGEPPAEVRALQTLRISTSLAGLLILVVTICTWQIAPIIVRNIVKLIRIPAPAYVQTTDGKKPPAAAPMHTPLLGEMLSDTPFGKFASRVGDDLAAGALTVNSILVADDHAFMMLLACEAHGVDLLLRGDRNFIKAHVPHWGPFVVNHFFPCSASPSAYPVPTVVEGGRRLLAGCSYGQVYYVVLSTIAMLVATVMAFWRVIQAEASPPARIADKNPPPKPADAVSAKVAADLRAAIPGGAAPASAIPGAVAPETPLLPWGLSLNEAFYTLEMVGKYISWGIIFGASASVLLFFLLAETWGFWQWLANYPIRLPGFLVICGVVLLVAVSKVFGPILAVTLDVINWLRDKPADYTPRARIVARLLSVLSAVSQANESLKRANQSKTGYDQFIIVAHSQGTVIVVETLRALERSRKIKEDAGCHLHDLPDITLFTMGCPLRQLYARRFPHLFAWVLDSGANGGAAPAAGSPNPDPNQLYHLKQWVNAYGALDYVGRALWLRPKDDEIYLSRRYSHWDNKAVELCIGDVAHTHYWDTGSPIARYLHEIIEQGSFSPIDPPPSSPPA